MNIQPINPAILFSFVDELLALPIIRTLFKQRDQDAHTLSYNCT
jgi:hypothetical protein